MARLNQSGSPLAKQSADSASRPFRHGYVLGTFVFLLMVCGISLAAIQQNSVAGHWEGAIKLPSAQLSISIDVAGPADKLTATFSIPQQGAKDMPLVNVSLSGADFVFEMPGVPGNPKFSGKLSTDGKKIEGTFTQGGANFPCNFERKADPVTAAKESLVGFDEIVPDAMKKFDVPGMAIAIVKNKEVIYAKGFGYRDVEKQTPVTADTLFAIGSSSKAFTTFVLGTMVDEQKIEWDKPVRDYIPWFKLYDPSMTERLTVRDLITHRSGLPRHDLVWYNNFEASRESLVRKLAYLEPSADLREKWQYNNLMFLTAGYLIETVSGKSWEENVRDRILNPLDMTRTNFSVADSQKDRDFALGYGKPGDKVKRLPFRPITNIGPAGAINSSVNEMARWVTVHLNAGKFGDRKLAEGSTVDALHQPQMTTGVPSSDPDILGSQYAMGWFVDAYRGHERVEHGGNIDGFTADVVLFPKDGIGIVVLSNMNGTALPELISRVAADRLLSLKPNDWIDRAAARRVLSEQAAKEGAQKKTATRIPGTQPSHKLAEFVGDYENPGYGDLKVKLNGDHLEATFNSITTPLEHWHYDTFNGGILNDPTFQNMKYTFQTDSSGYVSAVSAPFEPAVKDIVFVKKPDERMFDASYIGKFAGEYTLTGQPVRVAAKGTMLTLQLPGQPPFDLVPTLSGDFALKQQRIVTVHFVVDENGKVTAFELRQPGTALTAKRKE